ncbi:MAG: glycosyltransferase family 2 protein, partial [Clostridia bacterium]|nr:glycosyltransferase family 2 protein [Clostridia bacterium]
NNDTLVTPGWLVNLKRCLASLPLAGLAGPRTNCAGSEQMMPVSYRTLAEMEEFARGFNQPDPGRWTEVERLVGFCLLVKRRVWEEVGPFDERFGPGNYEDDDYCLRVRRRGYRLILAGDTFVHHFGGVTFTGAGLDYRALLAENRETFRKKWGLRPG